MAIGNRKQPPLHGGAEDPVGGRNATSPRNLWISMSCGCGAAGLRFEYELAGPDIKNECCTGCL